MLPFARVDSVRLGASRYLRELHRQQMQESWRPDAPREERECWRERASATRGLLDTVHWADLLYKGLARG